MTIALRAVADALARMDGGAATARDRRLAEVLERHCQSAQRFCLICGAPGDWECLSCVIAAEVEAKRTADQ